MSSAERPDEFKQKFRERFIDFYEEPAAKLVDFAAIEQ